MVGTSGGVSGGIAKSWLERDLAPASKGTMAVRGGEPRTMNSEGREWLAPGSHADGITKLPEAAGPNAVFFRDQSDPAFQFFDLRFKLSNLVVVNAIVSVQPAQFDPFCLQ